MVKNLSANAGDTRDTRSVSGLGRSPERGNGNLLQYSCWKNPMDRGACWATVHGVSKELDTEPDTTEHLSIFMPFGRKSMKIQVHDIIIVGNNSKIGSLTFVTVL